MLYDDANAGCLTASLRAECRPGRDGSASLAVEEAQPDSSGPGPARDQAAEARCKVGALSCGSCGLIHYLNRCSVTKCFAY